MKRILALLGVLLLLLAACKAKPKYYVNMLPQDNPQEIKSMEETPMPSPVSDPVQEILDRMTIEEKIGQLFVLALSQDELGNPLEVSEERAAYIKEFQPGGFILFSENIKTIPQTVTLIQELQKVSRIPLFIAVDEEGGRVSRITKSPQMHATVFPNNAVIGNSGNTELAQQVASAIAREIASLGFNMNFAPVADVNTNAKNPVIGVRAYGSEAQRVADMVFAAVTGIRANGVCAVLKHFPGHGDTLNDSHYGAASVSHTRERLFNTELIPFIKGIEAGAEGIMTAHILTPEIPGDNVPATLKPQILTGILRNELGFDGLIITDALNMGAITQHYKSDEAAVKAILAGADILLMPKDPHLAFEGIRKANEAGEISTARIHDSVRRILNIKYKKGLFTSTAQREDPEQVLGCEEHRALAKKLQP